MTPDMPSRTTPSAIRTDARTDVRTDARTGRRSPDPRRILLLGATGTIGRATAHALLARSHRVTALIRDTGRRAATLPPGLDIRIGDATDPECVARLLRRSGPPDAIVSCLASRTGTKQDAWAVDHAAHSHALRAASEAGVRQMVLLSALCVQDPVLAFQHAKRAFEIELAASGLAWSIVRPTAYFKSLTGQVERIRAGRPYLLFGDGRLTATRPIADDDLAEYLADCLDDPDRRDRILPIGGPGPAITPRDIAEHLFACLGRKPRYRHVPPALLGGIAAALDLGAHLKPPLAAKAELARIGRFYATRSMLVTNPATGLPDASLTPQTGDTTLFEFQSRLVARQASVERDEHAVVLRRARPWDPRRSQGAPQPAPRRGAP